jgi:hypothetical protein
MASSLLANKRATIPGTTWCVGRVKQLSAAREIHLD